MEGVCVCVCVTRPSSSSSSPDGRTTLRFGVDQSVDGPTPARNHRQLLPHLERPNIQPIHGKKLRSMCMYSTKAFFPPKGLRNLMRGTSSASIGHLYLLMEWNCNRMHSQMIPFQLPTFSCSRGTVVWWAKDGDLKRPLQIRKDVGHRLTALQVSAQSTQTIVIQVYQCAIAVKMRTGNIAVALLFNPSNCIY